MSYLKYIKGKHCIQVIILFLFFSEKIAAQCSGCTVSYSSNTGIDVYVYPGDVVCVDPGVTLSGNVFMYGGVLCNQGTITTLRLYGGSGEIRNYGNMDNTEPSFILANNLSIYSYAFSQFNIWNAAIDLFNSDSLYFNLADFANVYFGTDLSISSKKLSIQNSGNFKVNGNFNINNAGLQLYNSGNAVMDITGSMNQTNTGNKLISNTATVTIGNALNVGGNGMLATSVTIKNAHYMATTNNLECTLINGKFDLMNAPAAAVLNVGKDLSMNNLADTLSNSGTITTTKNTQISDGALINYGNFACSQDFGISNGNFTNTKSATISQNMNMLGGVIANSGTITNNNFTGSGGVLTNNNYLESLTDFLIIDTTVIINNNKSIFVSNDFNNIGTINLGLKSLIFSKNYYNDGVAARIYGPFYTWDTITYYNDTAQYANIIVTNYSENTGYLTGHILIYDLSLTANPTNTGLGFDLVSNPHQISNDILFTATNLGTSGPINIACEKQKFLFAIIPSANPNVVCKNATTNITLNSSIVLAASPNSSPLAPPLGTSFIWQPGNISGQSVNVSVVSPIAPVIYDIYVNMNGCDLTPGQLQINLSTLAANAGPDLLIPTGSSTPIGGSPSASNGQAPYTYLWTPNTSLTSNTASNPTANPATATTYTLTVTDAVGCTDIDDMTVYFPQKPYAVLKKEIDAGFFDVTPARNPVYGGSIDFLFEEEYVNNGVSLQYKILKMDRTLVSSIPSQSVVYKENRYSINLSSIGLSASNSFYILETTDKKGEKAYLRFKY